MKKLLSVNNFVTNRVAKGQGLHFGGTTGQSNA